MSQNYKFKRNNVTHFWGRGLDVASHLHLDLVSRIHIKSEVNKLCFGVVIFTPANVMLSSEGSERSDKN